MTLLLVKKGLKSISIGSKHLILFWLLSLCASIFAQDHAKPERVLQRVAAPFTAPIQAVFTKSAPTEHVNSALPGLGTMSAAVATPPPAFAGSLEFFNQPASVPAIYVDGRGYVSLDDPSIAPYIDPELQKNPAADPAVVMIPAQTPRQIETTGKTFLSLPSEKEAEAIVVSAQTGWFKQIGNHEVYFLKGDCSIRQGNTSAQSPEAVVWIAAQRNELTGLREVTLYLESDSTQNPIQVEWNDSKRNEKSNSTKITDKKWLGHLHTAASVDLMIATPQPTAADEPAIYHRALSLLTPASPDIVQTQYLSSSAIPQLPTDSKLGFRRINLNSRSENAMGLAFEPYPQDTSRGILILTGGLNLIIEGVTDNKFLSGNVVDISADSAVVWMDNPSKMRDGASHTESNTQDFEIYLEGNIIYRDGPRLIEASKMYYDAKNKIAYILNGHLSTPISDTDKVKGSVRLKAEILRQMGDGLFTAKNAMITTSQLGEPTYSLHSRTLTFDKRISQPLGSSETKTRQVLVAENNYIAAGNLPVFYWPWMAADIDEPTLYIKNLSYGNSGRNGHTIKTLWNPFQIFNVRRPDWLNGEINATWMGKRGFGYGASVDYRPSSCFHIPGQTNGTFFFWGLSDRGTDQLGGVRDNVQFPHAYRYRLHWIHQQETETLGNFLGGPWNLRGELGKVSDRNFVPSFFNSVWHTEENATTAVDLTRRNGNKSLTLSAEYALDNCYSNANWLPRLDHFLMGQSLFNDYLTWYEHTRVGLVNYQTASSPFDFPNDGQYFRYLPWENNNGQPVKETGAVFSTRHEIDLPMSVGALRVIPFVLGDFSAWGADQSGNSVSRFYGQGGVRFHLPFWKVQPNVSSRRWYLNGLAHKIDFDAEYWYGRANESMDNLLLTDPLDNWSIDDFRRRYAVTNSFFNMNGQLPQFDPRYYALRSGMASNVSAGNMEIADDMSLLRIGMTHRFQTKRGAVGHRHIMDWITASTHVNFYPESDQNFGKGVGLWDYNVLWHVGDRFSLFSEGLYDFFEKGQNITRIGSIWNRPDRGSVSVMLDQFSGVVERTYLTLNVGYTMNEKYSMSYMTSVDIKDNWKGMGHNFLFARTGESFRLLVGVVYSEALSDWSFSFGLEPVFLNHNTASRRSAGRY